MSDFENKYFTFWKGTFMPKSIHENARSVGQKKTRVRESLFHMPRGRGDEDIETRSLKSS